MPALRLAGRYRIGMRWWLSAAFVLIAALTATLVATVSSRQSNQAVRSNSEDVAVGKSVSASFAVERALADGHLRKSVAVAASRRGLALYVFAPGGRLLTSSVSRGIHWQSIADGGTALTKALSGRRFVQTGSGATLTALPLRGDPRARALVAYAPEPTAYGTSLAIFRREGIRAAIWALLVAAVVGLVAAELIGRRLRRIDAAAAAIERGNFDVPLRPRFVDEVGSLALRIDQMRKRLRSSFEQLRAERDRMGRLLEQLQEGVIAVDEDGVVQFSNRTARTLLEREPLAPGLRLPEEVVGVPLASVTRGLFRDRAIVAEARATTHDGRSLAVVGVPAGTSELAVIVLTDITEQERRERIEREFVTNASHELRTPVTAITSAVEALQSGAKDSPADRDSFIELIDRQAARLGRLTRSLLLLARAQSDQGTLRLDRVSVCPLLENVARACEADTRIEVNCPPDLTALAQEDLVEQVVANLLGNALDHAGGEQVRLHGREDGATVVIEVVDSGPGIPPADRDRIFDRFASGRNGRREGFGLGLAIVRDAVRALGGNIVIDSVPGRGTMVRVVLAAATR